MKLFQQVSPPKRSLIPSRLAVWTAFALGLVMPVRAAVWLGMTGDLREASNWNPAGVPGNGETIIFNGEGSIDNVFYSANFEGAGSGLGGITLTSAQTSAVTINATVENAVLRLAGGGGITVESGAGQLTFGDGPTKMLLNLGGANGTSNFINNSANAVIFGPNVTLNRGGSSDEQHVIFGGTGNWDIQGTINTNLQSVHKTGSGTLSLTKNLVTQTANWDEGTVTAAAGLNVKSLRVGYNGKTATSTVTGGAVVIGSGPTHSLLIGYRNDSSTDFNFLTSGTLNLASATSVNINVGTLDIGWLDTISSTSNAVTGALTLSTDGTNTVRANSLRLGHISLGSVTSNPTTGTLTLGNTNNFFINTFTVGSDKGIGTVTIAPGGTLTLKGNSSDDADLHIGYNNSTSTGTNPDLSHLNLTGGTFNATLDEVVIGHYSAGTGGSGKGRLTFDAGTVTANSITLARTNGTSPQNTTGLLQMNGGTLAVAQGILDAGGVSTLQLHGGTTTIGNGLSVDKLRVGYDGLSSTVTVNNGDVRIGTGASDILELGLKANGGTTTGTLDLKKATSVTINVGSLDIAHTTGNNNATVQGVLHLSESGINTVTADLIRLGQIDGGTTGATTGTINLGQTNNFSTDAFYIGKDKGRGVVTIANGGTLTLIGKSTAAADLYIGANLNSGTSTAPTASELNLTGGTFNATLGALVIGQYTTGGTGGGKGILTFANGLITANSVLLASSGGTNPTNTVGTLIMNGGELRTQTITRGTGTAAFNFNAGTLKVAQFGDATRNFNLNNTGSGTLAHGVNSTIGTTTVYGNYTQGSSATLSFDLSLDSGADSMVVFGDITLAGTLQLNTFGAALAPLDSFTLISNQGSNNIIGTFNGIAEGHVFALDFGGVISNYTLTYAGGTSGRDVVLIIPEPSRVLLLGAAAICFMIRRRRQVQL
jgi:hypothetical protein